MGGEGEKSNTSKGKFTRQKYASIKKNVKEYKILIKN